ncbi:uncharacterized protein LOC128314490 [Acinonyx jubatus]|uniref:Uncharacterized protein LOC128314490 n=1 Tax=Acinonyx jubatus TaxID=32536 RepID=A0ABM3PMZ6_ACIJB|nr:uncharacterized protein LOC128314490 [Acinonyx jubatus]
MESPHRFWRDVESPQMSKPALSFASMKLEDFLGALCSSVFVFLCFVLWTYWTDVMGQTQTTPLSIMIDHFKDVRGRANNLSVEVRKGRLQFFCSSEWPTFNVGWPPEGTFDLPTIHRVRSIISQPKAGHLDQLPYIITWQDLVEDPPSWLKPFLAPLPPEPKPILALQGTKKKKSLTQPSAPLYPVLQGGTEEELIFPPLYNPSRMPEEHHPPPPGEADAVPRAGGGNAPVGSPPFTRQRAQRQQSTSATDSTILPCEPPDPQTRRGISPITIGLSPLVTSTIGKLRILSFPRNRQGLLIY